MSYQSSSGESSGLQWGLQRWKNVYSEQRIGSRSGFEGLACRGSGQGEREGMPRGVGVKLEEMVWKSKEESFKDGMVKHVDYCKEVK